MTNEKKTRTASLNIRKARAQDKLEKLEAWRQEQMKKRPLEIAEKFAADMRDLEDAMDSAIANVPAVVGVKYQEKLTKLLATFDPDVREALKSDD